MLLLKSNDTDWLVVSDVIVTIGRSSHSLETLHPDVQFSTIAQMSNFKVLSVVISFQIDISVSP